jgi:phosphatidylserine/phosphatidylglycerophosphate/cardiolipin synthase-like enzyme
MLMRAEAALLLILTVIPASASDPRVVFSPHGGATELIVKTVLSARKSIRMAAYVFTSEPIAAALIEAHHRGVEIRIVVDGKESARDFNAISQVAQSGIEVRADWHYATMHDKFIVVDGRTVEEGSFNYTSAAEKRNAENVVVLDNRRLAERYVREWEKLWAESTLLEH